MIRLAPAGSRAPWNLGLNRLDEQVLLAMSGGVATMANIDHECCCASSELVRATISSLLNDQYIVEKSPGVYTRTRTGDVLAAKAADELSKAPSLPTAGIAAYTIDVGFVRDAAIKSIIEQKVRELSVSYASGMYTATIVLAGAISEGILFDALMDRKAMAEAAKSAPRDRATKKVLDIDAWSLSKYIDVAQEIELLAPTTARMVHDVVREFRNMIHPAKQIRTGMRPDAIEARACFLWLEALARDVRAAK